MKIKSGKSIIETGIMLTAIASVFLFPDKKIFTYIGRMGIICLFIIKALKSKHCNNRFYLSWTVLMTMVIIVNLAVTVDLNATMEMALSFLTAVWAAFSLFEEVDTEEDFLLLCDGIIICEFLFCVRLFAGLDFAAWGRRKVGTMMGINVNSIGIRCALAIIVCLYCMYRKKKRAKVPYLFSLAVLMAAVFITGSRRALLLSCISIVFFMLRNSATPLKLIKTMLLAGLGMAAVLYAIYNIPKLYAVIGSRMYDFISRLFAGDLSAFDDGRDKMFKRAIELFCEKPIKGWGLGTFPIVSGIDIAYCHNNFAELLYTTGIFGFLIFYSYLLRVICDFRRMRAGFHENNLFICVLCILMLSDLAAVNCTTFFTQIFIGLLLSLPHIFKVKEHAV